MESNWKYDPQTKTITISANGLYALGPSETEQYFIRVEVQGGQDGSQDVSEESGSETK